MADLNRLGGLHYEMMKRCYDPNSIMWKWYGEKGIDVCQEWHDRESFKKWAKENGYQKGLRLERYDTSKGYSPENCYFGQNLKKNAKSKNNKTKDKIMLNKKKKESIGVKKYTESKLSKVRYSMIDRCCNPNYASYKKYGGRGIKICPEWSKGNKLGTYNFIKWSIENGYKEGLTLDRIDNNGDYCPENCRWADRKMQNNNRRNTIRVEYNGEEKCLSDISKELGIPYAKLYSKFKNGMNILDIIGQG